MAAARVEMLEIIVFGKGVGESILLHIDKKWIVVDSFIETETRLPVALKYLFDHGFDIEGIVGVICSHWDNDHVLGISQIIEQHSDGLTVCLPIVYNDSRFMEYVLFNSGDKIGSTSEFLKVLRLVDRKKVKRLYAIAERNLFRQEFNTQVVELKALSPNDNQYTAFLDSITRPGKGQEKKHIPLSENRISVVTYLKTCVDTILLGGDMENSGNGWDAICDGFTGDRCHVFKIPHHGSSTGFNENVWRRMVDRPISIITRFNPSNLPSEEMVKRIAQESSAVYVVGPTPSRDRTTINRIKKFDNYGAVRVMTTLDSGYGYVKLSKVSEYDNWIVETGGAVEVYSA